MRQNKKDLPLIREDRTGSLGPKFLRTGVAVVLIGCEKNGAHDLTSDPPAFMFRNPVVRFHRRHMAVCRFHPGSGTS